MLFNQNKYDLYNDLIKKIGSKEFSKNDFYNISKENSEYCIKHNSQVMRSALGKILEIKISNGSYSVISLGHDNPQGIVYDKINDVVHANNKKSKILNSHTASKRNLTNSANINRSFSKDSVNSAAVTIKLTDKIHE